MVDAGGGEALVRVLERGRGLGFLGPGAVEDHVVHSRGFVDGLDEMSGLMVDLGSGGGVPGLIVAVERPDLRMVLLEAMDKRCRFLEWAVGELQLTGRVVVVEARAEDAGRGELRGRATAVLSRGFGPPAVVAECAAPLLRITGRLIVSEPPGGADRWPASELAELGLGPATRAAGNVAVLEQVSLCPERFPRRVGIPRKRPLF